MGADIQPCEENSFDFIMSHIVMQHISNYSVRHNNITKKGAKLMAPLVVGLIT
jgi:hypothetical protein